MYVWQNVIFHFWRQCVWSTVAAVESGVLVATLKVSLIPHTVSPIRISHRLQTDLCQCFSTHFDSMREIQLVHQRLATGYNHSALNAHRLLHYYRSLRWNWSGAARLLSCTTRPRQISRPSLTPCRTFQFVNVIRNHVVLLWHGVSRSPSVFFFTSATCNAHDI